MKYAILGICVFCALCGYFVSQTYYARGKADCEHAQIVASKQSAIATQRMQSAVARTVVSTGVADIRRLLREQYTIAD